MNQDLPRGWTTVSPADIAAPEQRALGIGPFGSDLKVSDYCTSGVPLIFVRNIRAQSFGGEDTKYVSHAKAKSLQAHRVQAGDVLITKMGEPPGDSCVYPLSRPDGVVTADCIRWRVDPTIANASFVAYAIRAEEVRSQIVGITRGVAQRKISLERFVNIKVPIAPLPEQLRIVEALDSYSTRIDETTALLERVQRNLKRYRASVLKAAVEGRLVPTEAELARAEKRDYEPASVLLERILVERRQRWEEEGRRGKYAEPIGPDTKKLAELPEGWTWVTWSQIGFSQNGRPFPSSAYTQEGVRLLRPGNLHVSGRVIWTAENTKCLPAQFATENGDLLVNTDELVMNLTAQSLKDEFLGRICITSDSVCLLNQRLARLTPVLADTKYVLWMFKSPLFRRFVDSLNKGSLIQHMFTSQIAEFAIPLPPLEEQRRIALEVERQLSIAEAIGRTAKHTLERKSALRQSILKWAFEGKLVDQDPTDEPASTLLQRIRDEREPKPSPAPRRSAGRPRAPKKEPHP